MLLDTTTAQQLAQQLRLAQAISSPAAPVPGILLSEFVMAGYCWRLSLTAAPFQPLQVASNTNDATQSSGPAAAESTRRSRPDRQQLALCIICWPAWHDNLEAFDGSSTSTAVGNELTPPLAASQAWAAVGDRAHAHTAEALREAVDDIDRSAKFEPPTVAAAASDVATNPDAAAAAATVAAAAAASGVFAGAVGCCEESAEGAAHFGQSKCGVCRALCSMAVNKAAAAAHRHLTAPDSRAHVSSTQADGSSVTAGCSWQAMLSAAQDVVVGVSVLAAPSAALLQGLVDASAALAPKASHVACKLCWSAAAGAGYGLIPLDVLGIEGSSSSNLVSTWACRSPQVLPAGAVEPVGTQLPGADAPPVVAAEQFVGGGAAAAAVEAVAAGPDERGPGLQGGNGGLIVGWQPELWSSLAFTGELHWATSLRLLSD